MFNKFDERYSCIKIGGLYEYTLRDLVNPSQRIDKNITDEEKTFMDEHYSEDFNLVNTHTGIPKDKNVIFLQLEGMDSWLLNEQDTPNLFSLKNNSIDFTNHYSNATGGGSTINNEMAVNTGYYMPLGAVNNMIFLLDNNFKTTLAKSYREQGYSCNMFHMNKGVFYSRHASSRHLGYENYYGLQDKIEYSPELELDSYLIENEDFYEKMFKSNQRFMHYLITYTPHAPFTYKGKGQILFDKKYGSENTELLQGFRNVDFAKLDVQETDKMVGELIQALKDNNLYDDTVIVAFADHCQYGMKDTEIERTKYGDVVDLGNQTPFFIWSSNCIPEKVNKINMQIDIMPTVLNLFGIPFYKDTIIGHDVFDSNYPGVAFFQDKSFYDGEYYYKNDEVYYVDPNTRKAQLSTYRNVNLEKYVNDLISKNDIALLHDYIR